MKVMVLRVKSEKNPIKGSVVGACELCKEQVWIAPSTFAGVVDFQIVNIVCSCCMSMCNCCEIDEWEIEKWGNYD